jgi:integrase
VAGFSTRLQADESIWDVKSGRAFGKSKATTSLNRELNLIGVSVYARYRELSEKNGSVTAAEVKNAISGMASVQKTLLGLYDDMLDEFRTRVGIDRSEATLVEYKRAYRALSLFLKDKLHVHDIPLGKLDLDFIESFASFLRIDCRLQPSTVCIMVTPLRTVALMAVRRNMLPRYPFTGYTPETPARKVRSLSAEELERLLSTPLPTPTQNLLRDLFVYSCFTGLSHADLERMTWQNIQTDEKGGQWITMSRQKTGIPFQVKLLDIPAQIMEKYRGATEGNLVFPYISLGQVNVGLKRIARHCKIEKPLTFHMARHTFASQVCVSQGIPIESISKMLGHRNISTTQRYARVNKQKIGDDMKRFAMRIADKFPMLS